MDNECEKSRVGTNYIFLFPKPQLNDLHDFQYINSSSMCKMKVESESIFHVLLFRIKHTARPVSLILQQITPIS